MKLSDYLDQPLCWVLDDAESCEKLLRWLAEHIAEQVDVLDADPLYDALIAREQLGSTGTPKASPCPTPWWPDSTAVSWCRRWCAAAWIFVRLPPIRLT